MLLFFLNFVFYFTIRYLIKKNIFDKKLAFIFIALQIVLFITTPYRISNRSTSLNSIITFEFFLFSFFGISASLFIIPWILNRFLSENKKTKLEELENKTTIFLYEVLEDLRIFFSRKLSFFDFLQTAFVKWLTKNVILIFFHAKEVFFLFFFLIPWLVWIFFFFCDLNKNIFHYSIYFFGLWLFLPRINSLIIFFCKNYMWNLFNDLYLASVEDFYFVSIQTVRESFWDFQFLLDLIFKSEVLGLKKKNKEEEIIFWKNLNKLIFYFLIYAEFFNYWKYSIPKIRAFFYGLNFYVLIAIIFYYYFTPLFIFPLYFAIIFFFNKYFTLFFDLDTNKMNFIKDLPSNLGFYQKALMNERNFSLFQASCGTPLFFQPRNFWNLKNYLVSVIVVSLILLALLFIFTDSDYFLTLPIARSLSFFSFLF